MARAMASGRTDEIHALYTVDSMAQYRYELDWVKGQLRRWFDISDLD